MGNTFECAILKGVLAGHLGPGSTHLRALDIHNTITITDRGVWLITYWRSAYEIVLITYLFYRININTIETVSRYVWCREIGAHLKDMRVHLERFVHS